MLRATAAVMFAGQRCTQRWSRALTLVELGHVPKQLFLLVFRALLPQLQILIRMLLELALTHCARQVLKLLLMCWPTKCLHNLRRIYIIAVPVARL
jgi:hypothetical protein